jgi:hypothetical protein
MRGDGSDDEDEVGSTRDTGTLLSCAQAKYIVCLLRKISPIVEVASTLGIIGENLL